MDNKGQSVMSEYVMVFFLVIGALVAITVFVQRALEARMHDARNYMINAITDSGACNANCVAAAGGNIFYEYEPYYAVSIADARRNASDTMGTTSGNPQSIGAVYTKQVRESTSSNSISDQLPPCASMNPVPLWCK